MLVRDRLLRRLAEMLQPGISLGVLGIGVEVNFFGSDSETGNTFHNIEFNGVA